ncbi:YihY/virulence factor BrkB family protein [Aureivirga sp. CE67]|uniref:YihY/virulence factor BrkB family protein n=1 Tax=Aureivirga sp. CE67 TaxID=1788983 RepID=UPI0018C9E6D1|nr:YihY/virulence factor BrkB family protein [Aureivirga sp. CE67]
MKKLIKDVFQHFLNNDTFQKGASLAYYSVFSLIPMIMIISSVLGIFFGEKAVNGEIFEQLQNTLGEKASLQIQDFIKNQQTSHNNILNAIIGFVTLALSASGLFSQIHNSFNSIWSIKSKPKNSILNYILLHFGSIIVLISLFFIILVSTALGGILTSFIEHLPKYLRKILIIEQLISPIVLVLVFAIMFKFLGDAIIKWKIAIYGGIFTAVFFMVGKIGIGFYLGHSNVTSAFGTASVLALIMVWVYYISQIIFLGASFIEILSIKLGYVIKPNKNAVKIEKIEITHIEE